MSPIAPPKLRVAITGGGLAGVAIANALLVHSHIRIDLFESREFPKDGSAVSLGVHAQRALADIFPSADELVDRAGATRAESSRCMIGCGPQAGTLVLDVSTLEKSKICPRAGLLHELFARIPPECMHTGKQLEHVESRFSSQSAIGSELVLHFSDKTTVTTDVLIGTDGIFSFVRQYILGKDHAAAKPVPTSWAGMYNTISFEKAQEKLGKGLFETDRQYGWITNGGILVHSVMNGRQRVQFTAGRADWDPETMGTTKIVTRADLEKLWGREWLQSSIGRPMVDLMLEQPAPTMNTIHAHLPSPTFAKGRACIAGDAAYAMKPTQQAAAPGLVFEDAVILATLFAEIRVGAINSPVSQQVEAALEAYDSVRRPRAQEVATTSEGTGQIMTGQVPELGLDASKLREALIPRWDCIFDLDLQAHKTKALDFMNTRLTKARAR